LDEASIAAMFSYKRTNISTHVAKSTAIFSVLRT